MFGKAAAAVPPFEFVVVWKSQPATVVPLVAVTTVREMYGPHVFRLYQKSWPEAGTAPFVSLSATLSMMDAHGVMSRVPSSLVSRSWPPAPALGARVW